MRQVILCAALCFVTSAGEISLGVLQAPVALGAEAISAAKPASASDELKRRDEDVDVPSGSSDRAAIGTFSKAELCATAILVAESNSLPGSFFARLIQQESGFSPHVVSPAGAQGIAQFMPQTASSRGLADPFEPIGALAASGKYLAELVGQFGNLGLAAAAYNAGPKRVQEWIARRGTLPAETRHYVFSVTGHAAEAWVPHQALPSSLELSPAANCRFASDDAVRAFPAWKEQAQSFPSATVRPMIVVAERHSLPRPSQFIVGRPVSAAIKAAEAKVLARLKSETASKARRDAMRVASIR
jgi:Transglycosylase SLT domain